MVDIQITSDEPKGSFYAVKLIDHGVNCRIEKLDTGDFLVFGKDVADSTLIEHKAASDFLGSIEGQKDEQGVYAKGRIWNQLERMKESGCGELIVAVVGNPFDAQLTAYRKNGFSKNRIWGAMRAIHRYGVNIQMIKNDEEFVEFLAYLSKNKKAPKREFALRVSAPNKLSLKEKKIYLLEGFPGIGPKRAKEILKKKTIMEFLKGIDKSDLPEAVIEEIKKIVN